MFLLIKYGIWILSGINMFLYLTTALLDKIMQKWKCGYMFIFLMYKNRTI